MHYVKLLKTLRKENGLTQQQVADYLHLDRSSYAYYESGRTKINIDILIRLAQFFQISLAMLVGEELPAQLRDGASEENREAALIDESVSRFSQLTRDEQYLVILYRSGTPGQRLALLEQADALTAPAKKAL
ncbi:MAG: helix-turn-helix domain-containing protein [Oscillospiraceae bacterium]|nr:helix-turn-helix domain-containing protein [Oscillospiraceae bacterium]